MNKEHYPGKGCDCGAHDYSECGCDGVDWRSNEEILCSRLDKLRSMYFIQWAVARGTKQNESVLDLIKTYDQESTEKAKSHQSCCHTSYLEEIETVPGMYDLITKGL